MKILIIGFGSAGQAHKNNIEQIGGFDVKAYDPFVSSLPMLKDLHTFDGFIIASPTGTHLQYLQKLAVYRKPILCEKPIVSDQVPSNRLIELQETNSCIYVAYQMRYLKQLVQLKEDLLRGEYGEIYEISAKYGYDIRQWHGPSNPYLDRVGVLLEASHELDYLWWIFDQVSFVNGVLGFREDFGKAECQSHLQLDAGPGMISLQLNYIQKEFERFIRIIGTKKSIEIHFSFDCIASARIEMMKEWLSIVAGGDAKNLATLHDSMKILTIIRQAKKGRDVII